MKGTFGAHETFHFREGWLRKGLLGIQQTPYLFADPYAGDLLGVGHNMVKAIRYWLQATNLAEARQEPQEGKKLVGFYPTPLAGLILEEDEYFEQDGTLWLLHYHLAMNKSLATTWYWFFNVFGIRHFTQDVLVSELQRFVQGNLKRKVKPRTLERDFRCLVRTYVGFDERTRASNYEDSFDCPLAALGLVQHLPLTRSFRLTMPELTSLHPLLVAYALTELRATQPLQLSEFSLRDAQFHPGSPGRVFGLDSETLYDFILKLHEQYGELVSFTKTAGLNVMTIHSVDSLAILKRYYQEIRAREGAHA